MAGCDHCRELLWDGLYGLLDAPDRDRLREHLASCTNCRAEQTVAQAQYDKIARAARLQVEIPLFTAPRSNQQASPIPEPVIPITTHPRFRARTLRWAAAAAVILGIGLTYGSYRSGVSVRQLALRQTEQQVNENLAQKEKLRQEVDREKGKLLPAVRSTAVRMQVLGPASYQVGTPNTYRILTSDLDGKPTNARVSARLLDAQDRVRFETSLASAGEVALALPANVPIAVNSMARLQLVASDSQGEQAESRLESQLRVVDTSYVTRLDLDKRVYYPGEKIFFRSLTLEHYALRPPEKSFLLEYRLKDAAGVLRTSLTGSSRPDGLGTGELVVRGEWPEGEYKLTVSDIQNHFSPVTRRLFLRNPAPKTTGITRKSDGTATGKFEVEFFPEGGDLVAGLPSRVYFRARNAAGQPAALEGEVLDGQGRVVATVKTSEFPSLGLGDFTLNAQPDQSYRLRVTLPQAVTTTIPLPPVRPDGVVLTAKQVVLGVGEPLRIRMAQGRSALPLVVGVACRGHLVAEAALDAKSDENDVTIPLPDEAFGVMRVSVFRRESSGLRPAAERLVYRRGNSRLDLQVQADKKEYRPGDSVHLAIHGANESGKPESASLLVAVVDQEGLRLADDPAEQGLAAYFHLTTELNQPTDLEHADLLLSDSPVASQALDRFLGTQGWRRFLVQPEQPDIGGRPRPRPPTDATTLVMLDNQAQAESRLASVVASRWADYARNAEKLDKELTEAGKDRLAAMRAADDDLREFEARTSDHYRLGLGIGRLATLTGGVLLFGFASVRMVRGRASSRRAFAGAFGALSLCLATGIPGIRPAPLSDRPFDPDGLARKVADSPSAQLALALPGQGGYSLPSVAVSPTPNAILKPAVGYPVAFHADRESSDRENLASGKDSRAQVFIARNGGSKNAPLPPPVDPRKPLPLREYARLRSTDPAGVPSHDTILWQPALALGDGSVRLAFDLPDHGGAYRIQVYGNSANGRLGSAMQTLVVRPSQP